MRFVGAFEAVLDPLVAVLDTLPAHFDPELAPLDILDLAPSGSGIGTTRPSPRRNFASSCCARQSSGAFAARTPGSSSR